MNCNSSDFLKIACEILGRGNKFRFQARGQSMHPFIMHGDILEVQPVKKEKLKIGEVIFYRKGRERAVAHRIVKKNSANGRTVFLTSGDSEAERTEKVLPEQVLGRVSAIEREGKTVFISRDISRFLFTTAKKIGGGLIPYLQTPRIYRRLARRWIKPEIRYQWEADGEAGKNILARISSAVVGKTSIDDYSKDKSSRRGFWIFGMWVDWRYRRLGIGRRLTEMACDYAFGRGAGEVKLLVFKDNFPAVHLYQKMGFRRVSIAGMDDELKQEARQTRRPRVIMARDLTAR